MSKPFKNPRLKKLVDPDLQLRMVAWFAATAILSIGLQFILTVNTMSEVALNSHATPADAYNEVSAGAVAILLKTLLVSVPLMVLVGIVVSHRITGPLVRMRSFLREVVVGRSPEDIELRAYDDLKDLAHLVNEVTRPLREAAAEVHDEVHEERKAA